MNRRIFMKNSTMAGLAVSMPIQTLMGNDRKFKICLNPGAIGVKADQNQLLDMAIEAGFEAIIANSNEMMSWDSDAVKSYVSKMESNNISWGAAGLPMDFRKDEASFKEGLNALPKHAKALESCGVTRMNTWIMPTHETLPYIDNFKRHARRLKQVVNILGHHGITFGMEYVGPKTLMARDRYPFIHSMRETKQLIEAIDEKNVGFVLDSFHWFCAQETKADLLTLDKSDIVTVDLNDAVAGRNVYEQLDWERELPGSSGVIDLESFVDALRTIGYDGPVRAEPFNQELRDMEDKAAVDKTFAAMKATCA